MSLPSCPSSSGSQGALLGTQGGGVHTQSGEPRASDEFQVDGLVGHQDNAGHRRHLHTAGVRPHLKCLDDLWGEGDGSASRTPWGPHPSLW